MTNIQIRDVSLFVKVIGQGYPSVLMHGCPSLDHTYAGCSEARWPVPG